ncbi:hypothetical protein [Pandoraea sp. ISTKB]|uniref:hypothetical protein n=1 Tax=Pandoraea sp. ISTKB TaxID=1586708 RepID=UPI0009F69620|nr:hypothetical protein [Pandoraea sp. ISTKB]
MSYSTLPAPIHCYTLRPLPRPHVQRQHALPAIASRGYDLWNHYEVSWLDMHERPQIAVVELVIPCDSPFTLEMTDAHRYFMTLRECRFESTQALEAHIAGELSRCLNAYVLVRTTPVRQAVRSTAMAGPHSETLDTEPVPVVRGGVDANLLRQRRDADVPSESAVHECLTSDLLSVRCPLSGGVDYGTVWIEYEGTPICRRSLMAYVLSYRDSALYIEQCVETLFSDILTRCEPSRLTVGARFTRRHGLDINPVRSTHAVAITNLRTVRQ